MYYSRQVKYLDYLENGSKVRSAGFIKIEVKDQICNILVNINGLYPTDSYQREVWISDGKQEKVLGKIVLQQGKGTMILRGTLTQNLANTSITYDQLGEIRIKLGKERELCCVWKEQIVRRNKLGEKEQKEQERYQGEGRQEEKKEREWEELRGKSWEEKTEKGWEELGRRKQEEKKEREWEELRGKSWEEKTEKGWEDLGRRKQEKKKEREWEELGKRKQEGKKAEEWEELGRRKQEEKKAEEWEELGRRKQEGKKAEEWEDLGRRKQEGKKAEEWEDLGRRKQEGKKEEEWEEPERRKQEEKKEAEWEELEERRQEEKKEEQWKKENQGERRQENRKEEQEELQLLLDNEEITENYKNSKNSYQEELYMTWMPESSLEETANNPTKRKQSKEKGEQKTAKQLEEGKENARELEQPDSTAEAKRKIKITREGETIQNPSTRPYFYEDKWKQLTYIYPHITPFQDEREYLSISPSDFVILQSKYHKLVNNSFLLHGYYNYEHLILARIQRREGEAYYIGVPGNFYEREKQVALMFGFESFECKKEPAQIGDYGYYMIRIEL